MLYTHSHFCHIITVRVPAISRMPRLNSNFNPICINHANVISVKIHNKVSEVHNQKSCVSFCCMIFVTGSIIPPVFRIIIIIFPMAKQSTSVV